MGHLNLVFTYLLKYIKSESQSLTWSRYRGVILYYIDYIINIIDIMNSINILYTSRSCYV